MLLIANRISPQIETHSSKYPIYLHQLSLETIKSNIYFLEETYNRTDLKLVQEEDNGKPLQ